MSTPFNLHTIYSSHQALPPLAFRSLRCGVHLLVHLKLEWMHKAECIPHQKKKTCIYGVNDMQSDFGKLHKLWQLSLNLSKCIVLHITTKNYPIPFTCHLTTLPWPVCLN